MIVDTDDLFSVHDYAKMAGVNVSCVYKWIAAKRVETIKIGYMVYIIDKNRDAKAVLRREIETKEKTAKTKKTKSVYDFI